MQNEPVFSTNKIIISVVFVCAALITSLFVFHMSHKQPELAISNNENVLVFPVPRDIKPFELLTTDNKPFTQNNFRNHWTLLFFGFTHCSSICPTTLDLLSKTYVKLQKELPTLQVILISLDPERDTRATLSTYVHSYHANFIGASGKMEDLHKFQSQLGVYSARDESKSGNYQIQHTPSIMLIDPQGKWAGVFKSGMKPDELASVITESVKSLSHS